MATMTRPSPPRTFQSSELSRNPKAVFDAAESGAVQVTRRDGEALVLMTEREDHDRDELLRLAGRILAAATAPDGPIDVRLAEQFPWMWALANDTRSTCAADILRAARASFATGQARPLVVEMLAWSETASALAAGLGADPVDWLDDGSPVARP